MFEKITDRTSTVLRLANEQAAILNHSAVHTGHVAIGLALEGHGVAANIMHNFDINIDDIPRHVARYNLTTEECAKEMRLLDSTSRFSADRLKHWYRGTEHLLLGIALLPNAVGSRCLTACSCNLPEIGQEILNILGHFDSDWDDFCKESGQAHPT